MNADGYITIGTKFDTKDLEKGIKKAEAELKRLDREAQSLTKQKAKAEDNLAEAYKGMQYLEEEFEQNKKLVNSQEELNMLLKEQDKLRSIANVGLEAYKQEYDDINKKIKDNASSQDKVKESIKKMNAELQKKRGIDTLKSSIDKINNKMGGIIKKAIRWGLAIFSVTSALNFIRSSISTISQYNTQMATNIEYIRWAMAMTLKPVVEYIVNLAVKLLGILRYIIKLLFNYDIFANASAKAFKKAKENSSGIADNVGKATKNAKELNKQLAGFDEMNILGDNVKEAGGTGGTEAGAISMPNIEIPEIDEIKIDWDKVWSGIEKGIKTITKNIKKIVGDLLEDIGQYFYDKASGWTEPLSNTVGDFFKTLSSTAKISIQGIGDIFGGLVKIIKGIFNGDIPTIAKGLFQTLKGIFEIGISNIGSMFNVLATPFRLVFNTMIKIVQEFMNWLSKTLKIPALKWDNIVTGLSNAIDKIKSKLKDFGTTVGKAVSNAFKSVFNALMKAVENTLNRPISAINKMIGTVNTLLSKKNKISKLSTIKLPRLAQGGIVNLPGSGVPIGSAIAGERGAEGVIPLTDSQQMALLGEAIGKYITVNANITNTMNGRVISRELQKIQNDNNFAYNR